MAPFYGWGSTDSRLLAKYYQESKWVPVNHTALTKGFLR